VTVDSSINGSGGGGTQGGSYSSHASVSPQTLTAICAFRFNTSGALERRQGNNATATYSQISSWKNAAAGSETIEFNLVVQNNAFGSPSLAGLGSWAMSGSPVLSLSATNQIGTATVMYTISDGSGNSLASGFLFLDVDSSP
jgi:hypothetical protein